MRRLLGLILVVGCGVTEPTQHGRVVTFGDSNTSKGWQDSIYVGSGYLDPRDGASPDSANSPHTLAGKLNALGLYAVNHAISGTTSGFGVNGATYSPNAREMVNGVTRFHAEVLGRGFPWHGSEPTPIVRVQAFTPTTDDFAYVSMGTTDRDAIEVAKNLRWMVGAWTAAGYRADHFLLTTLAPAIGPTYRIPETNDSIRVIAHQTGVRLIDLAHHTSSDNGRTWRSADLHVGDGVHYRESVRNWLASQISAAIH